MRTRTYMPSFCRLIVKCGSWPLHRRRHSPWQWLLGTRSCKEVASISITGQKSIVGGAE